MLRTLFLLLFATGTVAAQVNLNQGLMAYYPFSGNANDVSGNNNNPVFNNATLTADRLGNPNSAYSFNGTSNYMRILNSPTLNYNTQMSLTAWVKVAGFYQGPCHGNSILVKEDAGGQAGNYLLFFDDNGFTNGQNCAIPVPDIQHQNFYGTNTPPPNGGYSPFIQTNQWYMVTYTSDGTTAKLYVNCDLKLSFPANGWTFTNAYDVFLGRMNSAQFPYWFNGVMDEVRIYNRALTTDEVNFLGGCNVTSGCIPTFQKLYGGNKNEVALSVAGNPDGTYVITGYTKSFGNGNNDGYLQKMDKNGNILWSKTFGGTGNDYLVSVKPTTDGGYIAAGSTASFGGSSNGVAWMVKTDGNGNMQWSRKYDEGHINGSSIASAIPTSDGGYAMAGISQFAPGTSNAMVIKTDNNGVVLWAKSFNSLDSDDGIGVIEDANALIVIANQYGQSSSFYDAVIMKLNSSNGSVVWARNYDIESQNNYVGRLFKTATGYSFDVTDGPNFNPTSPEQVVINTDLNGNSQSVRKVASTPFRWGNYTPTSDGGHITVQSQTSDPNDDIHMVKVSASGVIQWTRRFGGTGSQNANDIIPSSDGGYLIAGINNGTPSVSDSSNIFIVKTDSLGNAPNCTTGTTVATVTNPPFTVSSSFVWASVTNLSFAPTAITPVSANPNPFTTTLCSSICPTDTIINNYTPVLSLDICKNTLTVENSIAFNTGDTVLMIQMKGAVIDSTNTAAFGTITDYKNAGNYEFNYVKSKTGNIIELKNTITRQYDVPGGKVQLIRVPYYQKANFTSTLTCLPWDGSKGGVLVLNVQDSIILNAHIDVSGKGFRGGVDPFSNPPVFNCYENQYYYPVNPDLASGKGEGIAEVSASRSFGKGALANGGGSGNSHNSGGGGGSNAATGGFGGYNFEGSPCDGTVPFDNRGIGGNLLTYSNAANKIFLGGGGGAGHSNNPEAFQAIGGNGSGIVIIMADKLKTNTNKIIANGSNGVACGNTGSGCHEGMGGGGAGGTTLLKINNYIDPAVVEIKGGNGANMIASGFGKVGPGGGGGGGKLWLTNPSLPAGVSATVTAGQNGVCTAYANNAWGTTPGQLGSTLFNLIIPVDIIPFRPNIDSVRIKDSMTACKAFDFKGFGYTNTNPIALWQWNFGDAGTANTQNPSHLYATAGTYTVKLIVIDINGCKDSITKTVTAIQFVADAGNDTAVCSTPSVSVTLHASAGSSYSWTPAIYLNNPTLQNPTATISTTTRFYVTITNFPGCTATDSVLITMITPATPSITNGTASNNICTGNPVTFTATVLNGGATPVYQWFKNGNPVGTNSSSYTDGGLNNGDIIKCRLTTSVSCALPATVESNSIIMSVTNAPASIRYPTVTALISQPFQLQARNLGGNSYNWQPIVGLNNHLIINPVFTYSQTQEYRIFISTSLGCQVVDTQLVKINGKKGIYVPRAFSPNGDGINDRLYPILVGIQQLYYFRVYNRWGNLIFETTSGNPATGWDGKYKGYLQPVETYAWVAQGIDVDGIVIKKSGNTFLLR